MILEGQALKELSQNLVESMQNAPKVSLKSNHLSTLPSLFGTLKRLYYLNIASNRFTEFPAAVTECNSIEILDLSHNMLKSLPPELIKLRNLKVLCLSGNQLTHLPPVIAALPNLVHLEINENPIVLPPQLNPNDEEWAPKVQAWLRRPSLDGPPPLRHRSESESGLSKQAKRMGFVVQRNIPYADMLHSRALSRDAAADLPMLEKPQPGISRESSQAYISTQPSTPMTTLPSGPASTSSSMSQISSTSIGIEMTRSALEQIFKSCDAFPPRVTAAWSHFNLASAPAAGLAGVIGALAAPDALARLCKPENRRALRIFVTSLMPAWAELQNSWSQNLTSPASASATTPFTPATASSSQDGMLLTQLDFAVKSAQRVLSLLNDVIANSATATASATSLASTEGAAKVPSEASTAKIRELSTVCLNGVAATKKLRLVLSSKAPSRLWDETQSFLKAIIAILGAIKSSVPHVPLLNDPNLGPEVSALARVAKEIPALLEQSSCRPSAQPHLPPPPTPLTASLGTAAQVLSPGLGQVTPFFE